MKKHALMLTAAAVAMMARPALADTTITTKVTKVQKTSTDGNIIIGTTSGTTTTPGSVVVSTAGPAIEIDSNNTVKSTLAANTISNAGTNSAVGVWLDGLSGGNGPGGTPGCPSPCYALDNYGAIDLTGSGTGKTGIMIGLGGYNSSSPPTTGIFNGGIHLESGSSLSVTGDSSYGIRMESGVTMNGNIAIDGGIAMNPTNTSSTSAGNVIAVDLGGTLNGNFSVASTGTISATGSGAEGVVLAGDGALSGSFTNNGTIATQGVSTSTTSLTGSSTNYPEAGSAVIIGNSITGGFYNAGPVGGNSTARATISVYGSGPAISISPVSTSTTTSTTPPLTIGGYAGELGGQYGFINRGTIAVKPTDPDASAIGISMSGGSTSSEVTIAGGIWNSGALTVSTTTDTKATTAVSATGLYIGNYATVPTLVNDNTESNSGTISATVSGVSTSSASATAISIGQYATVNTLTNSGTITASASTNATNTSGLTYSAIAINDLSGTLTNITNTGSISAQTSIATSTKASATTTNINTQTTVAAYLGNATGNITFTNTGKIFGDITFGNGDDTLTVTGTPSQTATITSGTSAHAAIIDFGIGNNTLDMSGQSTITGTVIATNGTLNVNVGAGSTLDLTNSATGLTGSQVPQLNVGAGGFTVADGGTLDMTVSQVFNTANASIAGATYDGAMVRSTAGSISLGATSTFNLSYGSFVSGLTPTGTSQFVLLDTPKNTSSTTYLTVANYSTVNANVTKNLPYLFNGGLCGYNLAVATPCSAATPPPNAATDSQLVLELTPKNADQLGLTGNAKNIFTYANAALAKDDPLGGAFVSNIRDQPSAQSAYSSFLPDLSDSSRQVAVDITDQATGPVGARQRALRMYAAQPGGATLWGQEFDIRDVSGGNTDAYRTNGWGFALGMDEGDPRNGRYGAAITFFSGDQTNKGPNFTKTSNLWYMLTGYTDWRGKGLFFDSQLSFGYGSLTGNRHLQLTDSTGAVTYSRTANGKRPGLLLAAGISTGVVLTYGSTVIVPQFSLDGLTMREEGYTESGGGSANSGDGFDLKINPYYANSLRGYLGTAVRQDINLGDFYLQPEVRVGYRYDFLADAVKLRGAFASMASTAGSQFTLTGRTPNKGDLVGGLDLAVTTGAWSLGVSYDYLRGNGGASTQAGMVTLVGRI